MLTKLGLRSLQILDFGLCFHPNNQFIYSCNLSDYILWKNNKALLHNLKFIRKISVYFADFLIESANGIRKNEYVEKYVSSNFSSRKSLCTIFSKLHVNLFYFFLLITIEENTSIFVINVWCFTLEFFDGRDTRLHFSQVTSMLLSCGMGRATSGLSNMLNNKWYELMDWRVKNMQNFENPNSTNFNKIPSVFMLSTNLLVAISIYICFLATFFCQSCFGKLTKR